MNKQTEAVPAEKLSSTESRNPSEIVLRNVTLSDATQIWDLTRQLRALDSNSCYAYLLLCDHFCETCFVADIDGQIAGFVTAYRPPNRPGVVFVWQVAVADWAQKRGIAGRLLDHLVASPACSDIEYLEATITPSNVASQKLFTSFAKRQSVLIRSEEHYRGELFGDSQHEAEDLFRIGPFPAENANS